LLTNFLHRSGNPEQKTQTLEFEREIGALAQV
jgi:hypothetical protein